MRIAKFLGLQDNSARFLLLANILTIISALALNWSFGTIIMLYWLQSAIIGFFTFWKLIFLGSKAEKSGAKKGTGFSIAFFFAVHYGFFHFVYFSFIGGMKLEWQAVLLMGLVFLANHFFSFAWNLKKSPEVVDKKVLEQAFTEPYARIIPMHMTIIFGVIIMAIVGIFFNSFLAEKAILLFFLVLKTIADLKGHSLIHSKIKKDTRFAFRQASLQ